MTQTLNTSAWDSGARDLEEFEVSKFQAGQGCIVRTCLKSVKCPSIVQLFSARLLRSFVHLTEKSALYHRFSVNYTKLSHRRPSYGQNLLNFKILMCMIVQITPYHLIFLIFIYNKLKAYFFYMQNSFIRRTLRISYVLTYTKPLLYIIQLRASKYIHGGIWYTVNALFY